VNVSETGVQIQLEAWFNLPDELEIELVGDFGATVRLKGQIIWTKPVSDSQVLISVDFLELTQAQMDRLTIVLYSDVREWYSQHRSNVDAPLASFWFLAKGLGRAFRPIQAAQSRKVRKQILAHCQLYWNGNWYSGRSTELGFSSLRLEFDESQLGDRESIESQKPLVGLLLAQEADDPSPTRLLAKVDDVEVLAERGTTRKIALELSFPRSLKPQQEMKIKHLMTILHT
jgi:cellulose synthase (UDP-forming)